jgi:hypothetical protein
MDVALPDGQSATFRDVLMRGDIREAKRGMVFITNADGSRRTDGALMEDLTGRVIARMLVSWTLPGKPVPGQAQGEHLQQQILDNLDDGTWSALEAAVAPWVQRILQVNRVTHSFIHTASGEVFDVTDPDQAQRLAASPDFTAIESPDPKLRGAKAIGTSSSASEDGPTSTE